MPITGGDSALLPDLDVLSLARVLTKADTITLWHSPAVFFGCLAGVANEKGAATSLRPYNPSQLGKAISAGKDAAKMLARRNGSISGIWSKVSEMEGGAIRSQTQIGDSPPPGVWTWPSDMGFDEEAESRAVMGLSRSLVRLLRQTPELSLSSPEWCPVDRATLSELFLETFRAQAQRKGVRIAEETIRRRSEIIAGMTIGKWAKMITQWCDSGQALDPLSTCLTTAVEQYLDVTRYEM